ncbi:prepilin-type N-terminal cleavage/methylation domain-containing protein [Rhodoferax saidenbachensis]|nr:prepilin-type N-terminal cleavage/methylation domain-containing protein [Rhodoferax saidenbachensis]
MSNRRQHCGFTLIEVIIFIVVVGVGLAGILSVMNTVVKSSADPLIAKQTVAIAESMLEEILLKEYCDPDTRSTAAPPVCPARIPADQEAARANFDDVDDYNGYTHNGIVDLTGAAVAGLANYNITNVSVAVTTAAQNTALNAVGAKRVTVTVTGPQGPVTLTGYRSNY